MEVQIGAAAGVDTQMLPSEPHGVARHKGNTHLLSRRSRDNAWSVAIARLDSGMSRDSPFWSAADVRHGDPDRHARLALASTTIDIITARPETVATGRGTVPSGTGVARRPLAVKKSRPRKLSHGYTTVPSPAPKTEDGDDLRLLVLAFSDPHSILSHSHLRMGQKQ